MTTIAYNHKDKEIAVDSRTTFDGRINSDSTNKVTSIDGVKFILAGSVCDNDLFIDYYFERQSSNLLPDCSGFVIDDGVAYGVAVNEHGNLCKWKLENNDARGSGCDFALAAMDFGCSAKDAVKYAMTRDIYTGGRVRVIKVK